MADDQILSLNLWKLRGGFFRLIIKRKVITNVILLRNYPRFTMTSLQFIVHPIPGSEDQLNDR